MDTMTEARLWLAEQLRTLADDLEQQRVLAFSFSSPAEFVELKPEDGDTLVRRAFTGVRSLYVTYTEHPLTDGRVQHFHDANIRRRSADGD